MIELRNVQKTYDDFSIDISFHVQNSEIVSLLGSSGSGKTTALRLLAGFEKADAGSILIDGTDVTRKSARERKIGFVFQDYTLFPHLNVEQNIAYGLRAQKVPPVKHPQRIFDLLELVGLGGFNKRHVQNLSGGEQQRVALARALAPAPKALFLDEPFSAVDTERREDLRRHVIRIQRELQIPVVFVTHSQAEALSISDRIVILNAGRLVEEGKPQDLYLRPKTDFAASFLGRVNFLEIDRRVLVRPEHFSVAKEEDEQHIYAASILDRHYRGLFWEYDVQTSFGILGVVCPCEYTLGDKIFIGIRQFHVMPSS